MEVSTKNKLPIAVSFDAWAANSFKYFIMLSEISVGIKLLIRNVCSALLNSWNRGNAVNKDKPTASRGTIANPVVKVKLEARCTIRS